LAHAATAIVASLTSVAAAADYPAPKEGDWIARDFRFHTGEVMPELRLPYTTVGAPLDDAALDY
jgi:homoserine O-acetyltransferase